MECEPETVEEKSILTNERITGMAYLEDVPTTELHRALEAVDGKRPTQRVMVGIAYKQGVSPTDLAEWYDLSRTTVYNWLARLERLAEASPQAALADDDRPGRPPKLTPEQRAELEATLRRPPDAVGYDVDEWTPALVQRHVETEYDVTYTLRHIRSVLDDFA